MSRYVDEKVELWFDLSTGPSAGDYFTLDDATQGKLSPSGGTDYTLSGDVATDISDYVRSYSLTRGRSRELDEISAGVLTVELVNDDGRFLPDEFTSLTYVDLSADTDALFTIGDATLGKLSPSGGTGDYPLGGGTGVAAGFARRARRYLGFIDGFTNKADWSLFALIRLTGYAPAADVELFHSWTGTASSSTFRLVLLTGGTLRLQLSDGSTTLNVDTSSTMDNVATDGEWIWLGVTFDANNGSSQSEVRFWTAPYDDNTGEVVTLPDGTDWTQWGTSTTTGAGIYTNGINDSTTDLEVGGDVDVDRDLGWLACYTSFDGAFRPDVNGTEFFRLSPLDLRAPAEIQAATLDANGDEYAQASTVSEVGTAVAGGDWYVVALVSADWGGSAALDIASQWGSGQVFRWYQLAGNSMRLLLHTGSTQYNFECLSNTNNLPDSQLFWLAASVRYDNGSSQTEARFWTADYLAWRDGANPTPPAASEWQQIGTTVARAIVDVNTSSTENLVVGDSNSGGAERRVAYFAIGDAIDGSYRPDPDNAATVASFVPAAVLSGADQTWAAGGLATIGTVTDPDYETLGVPVFMPHATDADGNTGIYGPGNIVPGKRVQVTSAGQVVFVGNVDGWHFTYDADLSVRSRFVATDCLSLLAKRLMTAHTPTATAAGQRIADMLDRTEIGWPTDPRDLDTGASTLGTTINVDAGTNALEYAQLVARSDLGRVFASKTNTLTFRDRDNLTGTVPVATFHDLNDDAAGIPFVHAELAYSSEVLYTDVGIGGPLVATQYSTDSASRAAYGIRRLEHTDLLLSNSTSQASALADLLLAAYKDPQPRFAQLLLRLDPLDGAQQQTVASLELGDRVTVQWRPYGTGRSIYRDYIVEGIGHEADVGFHDVALALSPVLTAF